MSMRDRRLVIIRRPGRHLMAAALASLAIPLLVGLPVIVFAVTPLVWGFFGFSAAWRTVAVLAGLLLAVGVPVMVLLGRAELETVAGPTVRCPPGPEPLATAAALAAWFTGHLEPAGVEVRHAATARRTAHAGPTAATRSLPSSR